MTDLLRLVNADTDGCFSVRGTETEIAVLKSMGYGLKDFNAYLDDFDLCGSLVLDAPTFNIVRDKLIESRLRDWVK
jgi:hypothetical protein